MGIKKIGPEYLTPLLGVWKNFNEIDFNELPNEFVLKTNHSSGWNVIVKNKEKLNFTVEKLRFNRWIKKNYAFNNDL